MQADEKKTLEPPVVQSLEDFKANCTLLENELAAPGADVEAVLVKLWSWVNWIGRNEGSQEHNDHFFKTALPRFTRQLLKKSLPEPVVLPGKVNAFLQEVLKAIAFHVPKDIPELNELLPLLFSPATPFYVMYGHPSKVKTTAGGAVEIPEDWAEELNVGEALDVKIGSDEWVTGKVVTMSPTKTELEVEIPGKSGGTTKQWFTSDDDDLRPLGTHTGGAKPAAAPAAPVDPAAEAAAIEAAAKAMLADAAWRTGLKAGDMVDCEDPAGKWFQALLVESKMVVPGSGAKPGDPSGGAASKSKSAGSGSSGGGAAASAGAGTSAGADGGADAHSGPPRIRPPSGGDAAEMGIDDAATAAAGVGEAADDGATGDKAAGEGGERASDGEGAKVDEAPPPAPELHWHVTFVGWPSKYDEYIPPSSARLARVNSKSYGAKGKLATNTFEADQELVVDDADDVAGTFASMRPDKSSFLVDNVEFFGKAFGFVVLQKRLENKEPPMPLKALATFLTALSKVSDVLSGPFMNVFAKPFVAAVGDVVRSLDRTALRQLDTTTVDVILRSSRRLLRRAASCEETGKVVEALQMDIALLCFKHEMLQRRLDGLKYMQSFLEMTVMAKAYPKGLRTREWKDSKGDHRVEFSLVDIARSLTVEQVSQWFRDNNVLADYFVERPHVQLMQRALPVLQFLAEDGTLSDDILDHVWACTDPVRTDSETTIQVHRLLGQLFRHLNGDQRGGIAKRLQAMLQSEYSTQTVELIRDLAISDDADEASVAAVEMLFTATQDDSDVPSGVLDGVQGILEGALDHSSLKGLRMTYIKRCLKGIETGVSIHQSLSMLKSLIKSYPVNVDAASLAAASAADAVDSDAGMTRGALIEQLDVAHGMMAAVYRSLQAFKEGADVMASVLKEEAEEPMTDDEVDGLTLGEGRASYIDMINEHLSFVQFCLSWSSLVLAEAQVDFLWDQLNAHALTDGERSACFTWFTDACKSLSTVRRQSPPPGFDTTTRPKSQGTCLTEEVALQFFRNKMSDPAGVAPMMVDGFACLRTFFLFANELGNKVLMSDTGGSDFTALDLDLEGLDVMWMVLFQASATSTASAAVKFLVSLQVKLSDGARAQLGQLRQDGVRRCVEALRRATALSVVARGEVGSGEVADPIAMRQAVQLASRGSAMLSALLDATAVEAAGRCPPHATFKKGDTAKVSVNNNARGSPGKGNSSSIRVDLNSPGYELMARICDMVKLPPRQVRVFIGANEFHKKGLQKSLKELGMTKTVSLYVSSTLPMGTETPTDGKKDDAKDADKTKDKAEDSGGDKEMTSSNAAVATADDAGVTSDAKETADGDVDMVEPTVRPRFADCALEDLPAHALSANDDYFAALVDLIDSPVGAMGEMASAVWGLLMRIPTNPRLLSGIQGVTSDEPIDWSRLLDPSSTFRMLYALQIVEAMLPVPVDGSADASVPTAPDATPMSESTDADAAVEARLEWLRLFLARGGFEHLCSLMLRDEDADEETGSAASSSDTDAMASLRLQARELLLAVFRYCVMAAVAAASTPAVREIIDRLGLEPEAEAAETKAAPGDGASSTATSTNAGTSTSDAGTSTSDAGTSTEASSGGAEESKGEGTGQGAGDGKADDKEPARKARTQLDYSLASASLSPDDAVKILASVDLSQLQTRLTGMIHSVASGAATSFDAATVAIASDLWVAITLFKPTLWADLTAAGHASPRIAFIVSALRCSEGVGAADVRKHFSKSLFELCSHFPAATYARNDPRSPHSFVLSHVLDQLPTSVASKEAGEAYTQHFELAHKLLSEACETAAKSEGGVAGAFRPLLERLVAFIKTSPTIESRGGDMEDIVLRGFMDLARVILAADPGLRAWAGSRETGGAGLVDFLWEDCLFALPSPRSQQLVDALNKARMPTTKFPPFGATEMQAAPTPAAGAGQDAEPPKCKTGRTRETAFALLGTLAEGCLPNAELSRQRLAQLADATGRSTGWQMKPASDRKSATGYVGIRNLGCICYMNSLMQQLFMMGDLRRSILTAPSSSAANKGDDLLYQLQRMFAFLSTSERQAYVPHGWTHAFKDETGTRPTNVSIQQDAQEYFNLLCDRLETLLKGTERENMLRNTFTGTLAQQNLCQGGCGSVKERPDPFYCMSLLVKNNASVKESLEAMIAGEIISDYACDNCEKRVDLQRRNCVDRLANTLLLHLQRFEFNYDTFQREKLNDLFAFPHELDLYPYSKEGLAWKDSLAAAGVDSFGAERPYKEHPREYYEYHLVGIEVHLGTANSGHYYSYIKSREGRDAGKWYEFNDALVMNFDEAKIRAEAYGGPRITQEWSFLMKSFVERHKPNSKSAYMLVYERKVPLPVEDPAAAGAASQAAKMDVDSAADPTADNPATDPAEDDVDMKAAKKAEAGGSGSGRGGADESAEGAASTEDPLISFDAEGQVVMPRSLATTMWHDNVTFLHSSAVYHKHFSAAVQQLAAEAEALTAGDDGTGDVDSNTGLRFVETCFTALLNITAHAHDVTAVPDLIKSITAIVKRNTPAADFIVRRCAEDPSIVSDLMLRCPTSAVRAQIGLLLTASIDAVMPGQAGALRDTETVEIDRPFGYIAPFDLEAAVTAEKEAKAKAEAEAEAKAKADAEAEAKAKDGVDDAKVDAGDGDAGDGDAAEVKPADGGTTAGGGGGDAIEAEDVDEETMRLIRELEAQEATAAGAEPPKKDGDEAEGASDGKEASSDGAAAAASGTAAAPPPPPPPEKVTVTRPTTTVGRVIAAMTEFAMLDVAAAKWQHFNEFFGVLLRFAQRGVTETNFLQSRDAGFRILDLYLGAASPFYKASWQPLTRERPKIGNLSMKPNWHNAIELVAHLTLCCSTDATDLGKGCPPWTTGVVEGQDVPELPFLFHRSLLNQALYVNALKAGDNPTALTKIMCHFAWEWASFTESAHDVIVAGLDKAEAPEIAPYFTAIKGFVAIEDSLQVDRVHNIVFGAGEGKGVLATARGYIERFPRFTFEVLRDFIELMKDDDMVARVFCADGEGGRDGVLWIERFLRGYAETATVETSGGGNASASAAATLASILTSFLAGTSLETASSTTATAGADSADSTTELLRKAAMATVVELGQVVGKHGVELWGAEAIATHDKEAEAARKAAADAAGASAGLIDLTAVEEDLAKTGTDAGTST